MSSASRFTNFQGYLQEMNTQLLAAYQKYAAQVIGGDVPLEEAAAITRWARQKILELAEVREATAEQGEMCRILLGFPLASNKELSFSSMKQALFPLFQLHLDHENTHEGEETRELILPCTCFQWEQLKVNLKEGRSDTYTSFQLHTQDLFRRSVSFYEHCRYWQPQTWTGAFPSLGNSRLGRSANSVGRDAISLFQRMLMPFASATGGSENDRLALIDTFGYRRTMVHKLVGPILSHCLFVGSNQGKEPIKELVLEYLDEGPDAEKSRASVIEKFQYTELPYATWTLLPSVVLDTKQLLANLLHNQKRAPKEHKETTSTTTTTSS